MKLTNKSSVELISYAVVSIDDVRKTYLGWMNDLSIIQAFGPHSMLYPKEDSFIENSFKRFNSSEAIGFFIYDRDADSYLGTCKLDKISIADRSVEIGIMIGDRTAHGKGIGKISYLLLLNYAFNVLGMNRVWGTCFADNTGSQKLFTTSGFTYEGKSREAIFRKGEYVDNLHYSILRTDYLKETD